MADRNGYIGRAPSDSSVVIARQTFNPTGVQTNFTFTSGYTPGYIDLFLNGSKLIESVDYTATDRETISLMTAAENGDVLEGVAYKAYNLVNGKIGIQSAGSVVGNVDTINFIGTGNTFLLSGTSVDVSITGGSGSGVAATITVADESSAASCFPIFATAATGDVNPKSGSNLTFNSNSGALSATSFVGALSGTLQTAAQPNVTSLGALTGLTVIGNAAIQGTLTYDDVTNIDSVGLITARTGIKVTAGGIDVVGGGLTVTGISTFSDGINVVGGGVGIADSIFHIGDDNTRIRFPAADTFTVETGGSERTRVDSGGRLLINTTTSRIVEDHVGNGPQGLIQIEAEDSAAIMSIISAGDSDANRCGTISLGRHRNGTVGGTPTIVQDGDALGAIVFSAGDGTDMRTAGAKIFAEVDGTPGSNDMPGALILATTSDGAANATERLRITSTGQLQATSAADVRLTLGSGGTAGTNNSVHIRADSADLKFMSASGGNTIFETNGTETFRVTSGGLVDISGGIQVSENVTPSSGSGIEIFKASSTVGQISVFNRDSSAWMDFRLKGNQIEFFTAGTERLRIASSGQIGLGGANYGTSGQVITSNGSGSAPTWQNASAGITTEAVTVTDGNTALLNLTNAQDHNITCTGTVTISCTGGTPRDSHTVTITNSGIATVGFSTYFLFPSGSTPSLPTASGAISLISFTVNRVGTAATQLLTGASVNFS